MATDTEGLIWHISDLHFGPSGYGNPGHSKNLLEGFIKLVESRPAKKDILLITGDCTTNGRAKEVRHFQAFLNHVSPFFKEIHIIPGNHDAWNSLNFFSVFLKNRIFSLAAFFCSSLRKRRRTLPIDDVLGHTFKTSPYAFRDLNWANKKIKLMLVDTTFRDHYAIAQGKFPSSHELALAYDHLQANAHDVCFLLLHHHIVRYSEPINNNYQFIKHDLSMRLLNGDEAKKFIKAANVKLVLHGHKHVKAKEVMLTNQGHTLLCASPAAFLDIEAGGDHGVVGFNVFRHRNKKIFLANMLYQDGFVCDDITQLGFD